MVLETEYYDALEISPQATELEIKKAYRRLAVKLHPGSSQSYATNKTKTQAMKKRTKSSKWFVIPLTHLTQIGEAYQVLSEPQLRAAYDKYGKEKAVPSSGFEDPAEFFGLIFGGEAFADWIGEISLMKDMTKSMDITMREAEQEQAAEAAAAKTSAATASTEKSTEKPTEQKYTAPTVETSAGGATATTTTVETPANPYSQDRPKGIPIRPALMEKAEHEAYMNAQSVTEEEKELRAKEKKKGGLSAEQREELRQYELERQRKQAERIETLSKKLVDRVSLWTETDKGADVTKAFQEKIRLEVENLKMESFGLEILHAIGAIYISKGTSTIKSHKGLFGISGFWSRLKDKGNMAKETWGTISSAIDAQYSMADMAKAEEAGGEEWTDERRAEHEKLVMGKLLHAVWLGSKLEVQSVLREVCDRVLNDRMIKTEKRLERAEALVMVGGMLRAAQRDPEDEGDFMVFEQLMAEAQVRRDKKAERRKKKDDGSKDSHKSTTQPTPHTH